MMASIKYIIILFFLPLSIMAQDPHFSIPQMSSLHLNPALTAHFDDQYQLQATYRNQWSAIDDHVAYNTSEIEAQFKLDLGTLGSWGFGTQLLSDVAGESKYRHTLFRWGAAYHMELGNSYNQSPQSLSLGLQFGVGQNSFGWSDLWFGRQFDLGSYQVDTSIDPGEPSLEAQRQRSNVFFEVNMGAHYQMPIGHHQFSVGAAMYHLNQPALNTISVDPQDVLNRKMVLYALLDLRLTESFTVKPNVISNFQSPFQSHIIGSGLRLIDEQYNEFELGINGRLVNTTDGFKMDAVVLSVIFDLLSYQIGLSYDITVSRLSNANNDQGAFELHFVYKKINY